MSSNRGYSLAGQYEKLRTPRGAAAAAVVALLLVAAVGSSAGSVVGVLILSPLLWWLAWWLLGLVLRFWDGLVEGSLPSVAVGRAWQTSGGRKQLRQDGNAYIFTDRGGILFRERIWFIGSGTPPLRLSSAQFERKARFQTEDPVPVGRHRDRRYWWYRDEFFWTTTRSTTVRM